MLIWSTQFAFTDVGWKLTICSMYAAVEVFPFEGVHAIPVFSALLLYCPISSEYLDVMFVIIDPVSCAVKTPVYNSYVFLSSSDGRQFIIRKTVKDKLSNYSQRLQKMFTGVLLPGRLTSFNSPSILFNAFCLSIEPTSLN